VLSALQSGGLLLSAFIRFLVECALHKVGEKLPAREVLDQHRPLIDQLLARKPPAHMAEHAEERGALALLCSLCIPADRASVLIPWARALLDRGAHVHVRDVDGDSPVQSWCSGDEAASAAGIIVLLEAGADLDSDSRTALWLLCNNARVQVLRELAAGGWLESANLDLPDEEGETPMACLQRQFVSKPGDAELLEMVELLSMQKQGWGKMRAATVALLSVHKQMAPDLAELVVSYIDGGQPAVASASAAAAAAASS
jgi:hypothetical protein